MNMTSGSDSSAKQVRENSVGWMLKRLGTQLDCEMSKALKPLGLNLNQFAILMALLEQEGQTQTAIGKKTRMPAYATTRTLDALEVDDYVERRADEHSRRIYRIHLSTKGREIGPALFEVVGNVNARLLASVSVTQQNQLKIILSKLLKS